MTDATPLSQSAEEILEDILEVMWFDRFESVADKRSLAADILRTAVHHLKKWHGEVCEDDLLAIAAELDGQAH